MAAGYSILEGFQYENEDDIFISDTHSERKKLYQRKLWSRSGKSVNMKQGEHYKSHHN